MFCMVGQAKSQKQSQFVQQELQPAVFALSGIMMHDVVSPCIASRYYMYGTIGSYALLEANDKTVVGPVALISHFPKEQMAFKHSDIHVVHLAALFCIYEAGMQFLPSGAELSEKYIDVQKRSVKAGFKSTQIADAKKLAHAMAQHIWQYSAGDGYKFLSAFPKYRPQRKPGHWFPTPPAYMDAADPNWHTMRPLIIDSSAQFRSRQPVAFDSVAGSHFMQLTREVYTTTQNLTAAQREIAGFWDCNPFVVATAGHMSLGFKKISPGGHWMNITCIGAREKGLDFQQTVTALGIEAITLYDAFIVCWKEKYATDRVRPETVINQYIDLNWTPLLQTPPFPEFTSGHSVISTASAQVLTHLMGVVGFTDDSEVIFELAPRKFGSFREAADEAAISRLYGGIHYRDAIEYGQEQGEQVANFIIAKLKATTAKINKAAP